MEVYINRQNRQIGLKIRANQSFQIKRTLSFNAVYLLILIINSLPLRTNIKHTLKRQPSSIIHLICPSYTAQTHPLDNLHTMSIVKQQPIIIQAQELHQQQEEKQTINSLLSPLNSHDQFHTLLLKELKDMKGTLKQKKKRLLHRLQKFFLKDRKINIKNGYFCKRRQPSYQNHYQKQIKLIDNQIILFGIDFIKIRQIVKAYLPEEFKPLDMSHIKLIFRNFEDAMIALRKNMRQDIMENETKLQPNQICPPKGWTEMRPYYINNYERRILARFATQEEIDIKKSQRIDTHVPEYANKIYNLKKKQSEDIEQNYRIREQLIQQRKIQSRSRRRENRFNQQNRDYNNFENRRNIRENADDKKSQESYTLKIGGRRRSQDGNEESNRERSRERDFDNRSIISKNSNGSKLAGQFANNMNLEDNGENQSVLSDVSFILDQEQNKELFEDMAIRLGLISIEQQNQSMSEEQMSGSGSNRNDQSILSRGSSSRMRNLTGNIPDRPNESFNEYSFTKRKWNYREYQEEKWDQDQKKKEQQRWQPTFQIIEISDDENQ